MISLVDVKHLVDMATYPHAQNVCDTQRARARYALRYRKGENLMFALLGR